MLIRTMSWGRADLSWSRVMERLFLALEDAGHTTLFESTNGYEGMSFWTEDLFKKRHNLLKNENFDIDISYTLPSNFEKRFKKSSKLKIGRYDYESSVMPKASRVWDKSDLIIGSSQHVINIFANNGAPKHKLRVLHSGVDPNLYNTDGRHTTGLFEILCIAEPHWRKQLDVLLRSYAKVFEGNRDVRLTLKTKIITNGGRLKPFEQDLRPVVNELINKYGQRLPRISIESGFLSESDIIALYKRSHVFALPTAGEGWGMPFLESMACGNIVIAPRHGGQLEFLNDDNSVLIDTGVRKARFGEEYGSDGKGLGGLVGDVSIKDFEEKLEQSFSNYESLLSKKQQHMTTTSRTFTWAAAAAQLIRMKK